uniref:ATP synthase F0 subunit 8 n=1 Tax=Leucoptera coffeella TaxID=1178041 RepID=UPI002E774EEC|nr:ATP synthase F0 subunit 8 [Leucoptera coffeella]WPR14287.1 ATP synthase F0 subunit 8 [Leucoptera coffeella]
MPQMMPINWIFLFLMFITIFLLFIIMNYFNYNIKIEKKNYLKNNNFKNLNWKW